MSVTIEWQDQHGRWVRFQQMSHAPSAWFTAKRRAAATGKRHRLVDEQVPHGSCGLIKYLQAGIYLCLLRWRKK